MLDLDVDASSVDRWGRRRTRQVHSSLTVEPGELGGIWGLSETIQRVTKRKIWLLGHLPGVGRFFTRDDHDEETVELVILLRPKRVEEVSGSLQSPSAN